MKKKQQTKRLAVMALACMLAACVPTGKVRMVQNTSKEFQLSQQQGVIVARVINASPYSQTFNFMTLSPKNVYEKKENKFERIAAIKKLAGNTTIFASPLPAGDYSLSDLYSYHFYHTYYYQMFAKADPKFGTFKVEPGKVTNLGTIIYYQKPDGDKYYQMLARKNEFKEALEFLKKEKPELHAQADPAAMLSWDEDDYAAERRNLYLNVVQNPVTFDNAYPQEDGGWYFTSKLGILLQRTPQGKWVIDALDTDYDLMLFNRNARGDMAVVDERGAIFFKGRHSKSWTGIARPDTEDTLGHVQLGDAGDIYLISSSEKEIRVYSGKLTGAPEWNVNLSYTPARGWRSPVQQQPEEASDARPKSKKKKVKMVKLKSVRNFSAVQTQGKTLVATNETLYELDLSLGRATKVPVDFEPTEMDRNAYNQLSIARYSVWDGSIIRQYSLDAGATWLSFSEKYDTCPESKKKTCNNGKSRFKNRDHIATPVFFEDGQGYSIIREVHVEGGFFTPLERTTTYQLVVSTNQGRTWTKSTGSELPKYCGGLRKGPDEKTLLLSCERATGQFYKADRETLSWQIDYQPALF